MIAWPWGSGSCRVDAQIADHLSRASGGDDPNKVQASSAGSCRRSERCQGDLDVSVVDGRSDAAGQVAERRAQTPLLRLRRGSRVQYPSQAEVPATTAVSRISKSMHGGSVVQQALSPPSQGEAMRHFHIFEMAKNRNGSVAETAAGEGRRYGNEQGQANQPVHRKGDVGATREGDARSASSNSGREFLRSSRMSVLRYLSKTSAGRKQDQNCIGSQPIRTVSRLQRRRVNK